MPNPIVQRRLGGGGFSPLSLPGLVFWVKADAITGLSDGASVATWSDQSGNHNDATQTTGTKQPVYKAGIQNGNPIVRFNGTNQNLITPRFTGAFGNGFTYFIVASSVNGQPSAAHTKWGSIRTTPTVDAYFYFYTNPGGALVAGVYQNNVGKIETIATLPSGQTPFYEADWSAKPGGNLTAYYNGGAPQSISLAALTWAAIAAASTETFAIGCRLVDLSPIEYEACDIAEIILCNQPLAASAIAATQIYLRNKWRHY